MADKSKTIIVRKIKKGHGEHHGGSWKVAYADFVTAMMAFFLLMWLISMVDPIKRAAVADYFRNYNIFKESGTSFMSQSSGIKQEIKATTKEPVSDYVLKEMEKKINMSIELQLKGLKNQVLVEKIEGGIRIQIVDLEGKPMFNAGSATPTERCRQILNVVAETLKGLKIRMAVEGHTDSSGSAAEREVNWELSTQRASTARKILEGHGIDSDSIAKVTGYADRDLLFDQSPNDPRNRRLSLVLLPVIEKKEPVKIEPESKEPPTLQLKQPSGPEKQASERATKAVEKPQTGIIDTGIKQDKPIESRPTLFPNMNQ
jgi:chemotaxis protein MotB